MLARYATFFPTDESFRAWYAVLAVHRHMRVLGNFSRQYLRDNKTAYLVHMPRVRGYLDRSLASPHLTPVREWMERWMA